LAVFRIDGFEPARAFIRLPEVVRAAARRRLQPDRRLIAYAEFLLVFAIGLSLGRLFWIGLGPITLPPADQIARAVPIEPVAAGPINPFRTASAPEAPLGADTAADLAETTLSLRLHGTWVNGQGGVAIIAISEDKQGRFAIGDAITAGVTLEQVYQDHVVILRGGLREKLRLINRDREIGVVEAIAAAPTDAGAPGDISEGMAAIGSLIVARPESDEVGGLRLVLQPAGDIEAFETLGLRAGDKLVAIDNQPIDRNIAQGLEALAMLEGKSSVTISVERDGVITPVTIALPQAALDQ